MVDVGPNVGGKHQRKEEMWRTSIKSLHVAVGWLGLMLVIAQQSKDRLHNKNICS